MSDYLLVICVFLAMIHRARGTNPALVNIISIQIALDFLTKTIMIDLSLYTAENTPLIVIIRNAFVLIAAIMLYIYRENAIWRLMLLLYTAAFLYNTMTFIELSMMIDASKGYFYTNYSLFGKFIITSIIIGLFYQAFGGGNKNYLGRGLLSNVSRFNNNSSTRYRVRSRAAQRRNS
jgi:hypothetical protein